MDIVEYKGWKRNVRLSSGKVELVATLDVGPRIIHLAVPGRPNVFHNDADAMGQTGEPKWLNRGGHRLWIAPEDPVSTYFPDNGPVAVEELPQGGVRLRPAPETVNGLQKEIDVVLDKRRPRVRLTHRIINISEKPIRLAPWALSVMAPGGTAVVGLPPRGSHPKDLLPNQAIILWPYTDLADPRLKFGTRAILLAQRAGTASFKIGLENVEGWAAYAVGGCLFVKRFPWKPRKAYPDKGASLELYTNQDMLEVESLGPMARLRPGRKVEHREEWFLFDGVPPIASEADVDQHVRPLIEQQC